MFFSPAAGGRWATRDILLRRKPRLLVVLGPQLALGPRRASARVLVLVRDCRGGLSWRAGARAMAQRLTMLSLSWGSGGSRCTSASGTRERLRCRLVIQAWLSGGSHGCRCPPRFLLWQVAR